MKFRKIILTVILCCSFGYDAVCQRFGKKEKLVLTEEQKKELGNSLAGVNESLRLAAEAIMAGDKNQLRMRIAAFVSNAAGLSRYFENEMVDRFGFGLSMAAQGQTYLLEKGKNLEMAMRLNEEVYAVMKTSATLPKEVREGFGLVLLQEFYKEKKWQEGAVLIEEIKKSEISSPLFIREVAGFANGMIVGAALTNEAIALYEGVLPAEGAGLPRDFSYGDALLNLSYLCGTYNLPNKQLDALNLIAKKDVNYFSTNFAAIAYWKYDAYKKLGDDSNAVNQIIASARAYEKHPEMVTDHVIRENLPKLIKGYQKYGYIDKDLTVAAYQIPQKNGRIENVYMRNIFIILMAGTTFLALFSAFRTLRRR